MKLKLDFLRFSPVHYVTKILSFFYFWRLWNLYIFENVRVSWLRTQMLPFFQALFGGHLGFSKWRLCLFKTGYILASKYHILMILVSKHTFWGSGNQMQWSRIVFIALFGGHIGFCFQMATVFSLKLPDFNL